MEKTLLQSINEMHEVADPRLTESAYIELLLMAYNKATMNLFIEKGIFKDEEISESLAKYFREAIEEIRQKPIPSPFS